MKVILGNKIDLYEKEEVRKEEVEDYAKSINSKFKYISAKEGFSGKKIFEELIKDCLDSKYYNW